MSEQSAAGMFRAAATATLEDALRARPEWATDLGDHRFDELIDDLSTVGLATRAQLMRRHRAELASLDPDALGVEDRVDLSILAGHLDQQVFEIESLASYTWDPRVYGVGEALYPLVTREVLPVADRLRAIAARLALFPGRLELARHQLDAPPRVHVETALLQHPGNVALVRDEVDRLLAAEPALRAEVKPAQQAVLDALEKYEGFLHSLLDGPHRDPRIGPDHFGRKLGLALSSPMPPGQLLARALRRVEELDDMLAEVAREYLAAEGAGPVKGTNEEAVRAALGRVAQDAPDNSTFVPLVEAALLQCKEMVLASGTVSVPDDPYRVELIPVFRRGGAAAYCETAGPLEEGGETSLAVAPTPDDWSPEQKASFYREYNTAMVTNLTVHEAMPGHMLQQAHARRFHGSTLVRQVLWSGTFVEGWAVHAERIMAEAGNGGLPVRLQQLKMQLRVAINAILDVSVHAGEMSESEALELMMTRGYQEESEARGKWRRACLTSAQLSTYFVGYTELDELFTALGDRLGYDELLAHGSPPPTLLRGVLRT
jgi:uncharacterized protein (DUF885 family)